MQCSRGLQVIGRLKTVTGKPVRIYKTKNRRFMVVPRQAKTLVLRKTARLLHLGTMALQPNIFLHFLLHRRCVYSLGKGAELI